ncbi:hypothetical protein BT96DRAFT_818712, partial [Gymnopus androsaceus JB14]
IKEEELRTRGTPVTVESFKAWKAKFDQEQADKKSKEEEERLKGFTAKERDEFRRIHTRLSGEHRRSIYLLSQILMVCRTPTVRA